MSASMASGSVQTRRSPMVTAWRSTGRSRSTRRNGGASAPQSGDARLLAPVGGRALRARELGGALIVVEEHALAGRVDRRDAPTSLHLAHARLGLLAVDALLLGLRALLRRFLVRLRALLLALLERLLGRH